MLLLEDKGRRETEEVKKKNKNKQTITKGVRSCALLHTPNNEVLQSAQIHKSAQGAITEKIQTKIKLKKFKYKRMDLFTSRNYKAPL